MVGLFGFRLFVCVELFWGLFGVVVVVTAAVVVLSQLNSNPPKSTHAAADSLAHARRRAAALDRLAPLGQQVEDAAAAVVLGDDQGGVEADAAEAHDLFVDLFCWSSVCEWVGG